MATGRAKEGVSSPINTHKRAWLLDSPPLAPAAARWLPRAAPRAGGAGAQRRRGPGVPGARPCWAAGLLRPAYGKGWSLRSWPDPPGKGVYLAPLGCSVSENPGKGLLIIYLFMLNKDVARGRQLASLGLLRLSVYFPGQEQMKSQKYHFRLLPNDTVQIKMWS